MSCAVPLYFMNYLHTLGQIRIPWWQVCGFANGQAGCHATDTLYPSSGNGRIPSASTLSAILAYRETDMPRAGNFGQLLRGQFENGLLPLHTSQRFSEIHLTFLLFLICAFADWMLHTFANGMLRVFANLMLYALHTNILCKKSQ